MWRQQREAEARTDWLSTLTLPVILGYSGAQGMNVELGVTCRMSRERRAPLSECGCILEGGLAESRKLQRR